MTEAMRSRGPDGEGLWSDGWVTLGHRRLTVIDLVRAASTMPGVSVVATARARLARRAIAG